MQVPRKTSNFKFTNSDDERKSYDEKMREIFNVQIYTFLDSVLFYTVLKLVIPLSTKMTNKILQRTENMWNSVF